MPTGFKKLDELLDGGFMRKELVVLGAPTGGGKSYIAGILYKNIAFSGFNSAYFSLEISNEMVASRLIGSHSNIKPTRIMSGFLTQDEFKRKLEAEARLTVYDENMFFYDDLYVLAEIEKEIRENNYDFIVIDFIQNIIARSNTEYERLSFISLSLQKIAKELDCCILLLSQLSNAVAKDKNVVIPEYKGSGSIATVCDLGFYIEKGESDGNKDSFNLMLKKNRRGRSGVFIKFWFCHPGGLIYEE
ncbi:MAG: DnaB-like helicase C-terminal domain-containing protein [Nitrosotalea sp.]